MCSGPSRARGAEATSRSGLATGAPGSADPQPGEALDRIYALPADVETGAGAVRMRRHAGFADVRGGDCEIVWQPTW